MPDNAPVWFRADVAHYLGVATNHLDRYISQLPDFPRPLKLPGRPRWLSRAVIEYIESFQEVTS